MYGPASSGRSGSFAPGSWQQNREVMKAGAGEPFHTIDTTRALHRLGANLLNLSWICRSRFLRLVAKFLLRVLAGGDPLAFLIVGASQHSTSARGSGCLRGRPRGRFNLQQN